MITIKESSHFQYRDVNLSINGFKWVINKFNFNKDFIKDCYEDNDVGYFSEVDVQHTEKLHALHNIYHFYQNEWKSVKKLAGDLYDNKNYFVHKRLIKEVLNHGLVLKIE